jgi:hypothetical protein
LQPDSAPGFSFDDERAHLVIDYRRRNNEHRDRRFGWRGDFDEFDCGRQRDGRDHSRLMCVRIIVCRSAEYTAEALKRELGALN